MYRYCLEGPSPSPSPPHGGEGMRCSWIPARTYDAAPDLIGGGGMTAETGQFGGIHGIRKSFHSQPPDSLDGTVEQPIIQPSVRQIVLEAALTTRRATD